MRRVNEEDKALTLYDLGFPLVAYKSTPVDEPYPEQILDRAAVLPGRTQGIHPPTHKHTGCHHEELYFLYDTTNRCPVLQSVNEFCRLK